MKTSHCAALSGLAILSACSTATEHLETSRVNACGSNITAFGSRAELKINPDMAAVRLLDVPTPSTAIGYGPSAGYRDELTLIDGVWSISSATSEDTVSVDDTPNDTFAAMFFVSAAPEAWGVESTDLTLNGMAGLEALLAEVVASSDCPSVPLAFQVSGIITDAAWSVVGKPKGAKGVIETAEVTLVGIYDPFDHDRYFMPSGQNLHVHLTSKDRSVSGHVSAFSKLEHARLSLPAKKERP